MSSKVYFTKEITPESLIRIYKKLWVELKWTVWVKVSTWEKVSKWYLKADFIAPLLKKLNGTIECNTANIQQFVIYTININLIFW